MSERKITSGRYFNRNGVNLDFDSGGYSNSYSVADGEKDTGITVSDVGHLGRPARHPEGGREPSRKRTIRFRGEEYPTLREAIFAYEDGTPKEQTPDSTMSERCFTCGGSGEVPGSMTWQPQGMYHSIDSWKPCPACKGSGRNSE